MRNRTTMLLAGATLTLATTSAQAWVQETHKRIVIDAVNYMQANPTTTNYAKLATAAQSAGYSVDQFAQVLGQGAYDVDAFQDTYVCGAITGDCQTAPAWGVASSFLNYSSWFHFQDHTNGADPHGNDLGGYNYSRLHFKGTVDDLASSWLWNDHLDDGKGGMTGNMSWLWGESSKYNSYGITEAHYRQGSYSTKSMYADFQNFPFQPIDNLAQYWYSQFWVSPTAQTLGFTLHATDVLQPNHTYNTLDFNHSGWESWVKDYYDSERLNDPALITNALRDFAPLTPGNPEIRGLLTQGGAQSYARGGLVLSNTDHATRVTVARDLVPHAIAMAVRVLNHAADRF